MRRLVGNGTAARDKGRIRWAPAISFSAPVANTTIAAMWSAEMLGAIALKREAAPTESAGAAEAPMLEIQHPLLRSLPDAP